MTIKEFITAVDKTHPHHSYCIKSEFWLFETGNTEFHLEVWIDGPVIKSQRFHGNSFESILTLIKGGHSMPDADIDSAFTPPNLNAPFEHVSASEESAVSDSNGTEEPANNVSSTGESGPGVDRS